ncbi:hypothetical protein E2C01_041101 [Portunus trituberculatus]|uniref:Uncharacterized protein n=1 Tax=Portunus trituberculatus TaxID=210409 RepID=A0A5B7FR01_PORTR|nr:hypothetical protein [Portunus trituberculatus]
MISTHHAEGVAVLAGLLQCRFQRRRVLHLPLLFLLLQFFFELLAVLVGTGRVVDESELKQRTKHKGEAHARPHVDGLHIRHEHDDDHHHHHYGGEGEGKVHQMAGGHLGEKRVGTSGEGMPFKSCGGRKGKEGAIREKQSSYEALVRAAARERKCHALVPQTLEAGGQATPHCRHQTPLCRAAKAQSSAESGERRGILPARRGHGLKQQWPRTTLPCGTHTHTDTQKHTRTLRATLRHPSDTTIKLRPGERVKGELVPGKV